MTHSIWMYLLVMSAVTLSIRILPLTLIRRQIKSRFIRSFLFYVPYITLAVMTFPDMVLNTPTLWPGAVALLAGVVAAWYRFGLFPVAVICSLVTYLLL